MKNFLVAAAVVFGLAACGKSSSDPAAKFKGFADQMCACKKDKDPVSCSVKVNVAAKKWMDTLDESKIDEKTGDKMDEADHALDQCMSEINGE